MKSVKWNDNWKFWSDKDAFALVWNIPENARDVTLPHDAMIEDPAYTLGDIGKDLAGVDADTVYIRNTRVGCDYQVDFVEGSYSKEVLGNEE